MFFLFFFLTHIPIYTIFFSQVEDRLRDDIHEFADIESLHWNATDEQLYSISAQIQEVKAQYRNATNILDRVINL